jgi:hypothetical protein
MRAFALNATHLLASANQIISDYGSLDLAGHPYHVALAKMF